MNVSTDNAQNGHKKGLLFAGRVEYKVMDDFKKTLSKKPWDYLEEGNYAKYLESTEVKKDHSSNRKELLGVYAEILTLIKDKQDHINSQFVDPRFDLVKHDFKCICRNTLRFQYDDLTLGVQKPPKDREVEGMRKPPEVTVKELDLSKAVVSYEYEKAQIISSRRDSEFSDSDPVVQEYFDKKPFKPKETSLKKKVTKKVSVEEARQLEESKTVKFDFESKEPRDKNLDYDRTFSSVSVEKEVKKLPSTNEIGLQHKNTYDPETLMHMPTLDIETLHRDKPLTKREAKQAHHKKETKIAPLKSSLSAKKMLEEENLNQQDAEMRNDLLHLLETVAVFSDLPKKRLVEISKHFKLKSYFTHSSIILAGEVPQEFYIVASGTVSSYAYESNTLFNEYKRSYLSSEYFGEAFIMNGTVSNEYYIADSHVTLQAMQASVFKSLLADLFNSFQYRLKEFTSYRSYRFNTMTAPSRCFTKIALEKFTSGEDTVKAHTVLGSSLMEFLNENPYLAEFKNLEKLSKRFSYQEYLPKEILVGVCKNDNLFLVYKGSVSVQLYEEDVNRQMELLSFAPGSFFFKCKFKSDVVSGLAERTSYVAKEKLVLLCLEDKYVEKHLKNIVPKMNDYLENLYKSKYLAFQDNRYRMLESDKSSTSSKSSVLPEKEVSEKGSPSSLKSSLKDSSVKSHLSLRSEVRTEEKDDSSEFLSSSESVLSSSTSLEGRFSRRDSSMHSKDGSSMAESRGAPTGGDTHGSYTEDKSKQEKTTEEDSEPRSKGSSVYERIVSRRSFDEPADVSIRSSHPQQLESSRTVSSVVSKQSQTVDSDVKVTGEEEVKEPEEENLLASSLLKFNEVLKTVGVRQSSRSVTDKSSPASKSQQSASNDDQDFVDRLMNRLGDYKQMLYKSDSFKEGSVSSQKEDVESVQDKSEDKKESKVSSEEELIRKITEEDFEMIRKNTLLASHVNISDTELSSRSQRSLPLSQYAKGSSLSEKVTPEESGSLKSTHKGLESAKESSPRLDSARESHEMVVSSEKKSSNLERDSRDSEVSSVGSDVKFIFNLDGLKVQTLEGQEKKQVGKGVYLGLDFKADSDKKEPTEVEEEKLDSSRVMGNDNFVEIRTLSSYYSSGVNKVASNLTKPEPEHDKSPEPTGSFESMLDNEKSEMSDRIVYRQTSSSHLLTSRTTNENVLKESDVLEVIKDLGSQFDNLPDADENVEVLGEKDDVLKKYSSVDSGVSVSSLENIISKNYPSVGEAIDSVMEVMRTRTISGDLPDLTGLEGVSSLDKQHEDLEELKKVGTVNAIEEVAFVQEDGLDKSPSLDFAEIPTFTKILSRVHDMYVNPNLPVETVSGSKFSSIEEVYDHLDRIEKLYVTKPFESEGKEGELVSEDVTEKQDVEVSALEFLKDKEDTLEFAEDVRNLEKADSLFHLDKLYKQSSYLSSKSLKDNIYDSERDEIESSEVTNKQTDPEAVESEKKEDDFALSFEELTKKITRELSMENLTKALSMDNLSDHLAFDNLTGDLFAEDFTKDLTVENITRELSNIGSSISSQISEAFSNKSSEVESEVKEDEEEGKDAEGFSLRKTSKLIITSIFDNIPLYNENKSDQESVAVGDDKEGEVDQDDQELGSVRDEVKRMLSNENVLIDKYNLVSRISLDSPSNDTYTSATEKDSLVGPEKEEKESLVSSARDEKESVVVAEKEDHESLLSTERSESEPLSSYRSGAEMTVGHSLVNVEKNRQTMETSEKYDKFSDLTSGMGDVVEVKPLYTSSDLESSLSSQKDDKDSLVTTEKDDESLVTTEKDERESVAVSERDTDKLTEKSLRSSFDKSDKGRVASSISMTDSINDPSFLSTESESHLTSGSDFSSSSDGKVERDRDNVSLVSNEDDNSVLSSVTYNTDNTDTNSRTSVLEDTSRLSSMETLNSESRKTSSLDALSDTNSKRTSSIDSNLDSSDQNDNDEGDGGDQDFGPGPDNYYEDDKDDQFDDYDYMDDTVDSEEEEEFEYDEESILSIKNLLMSTLKNKYKSLGASFTAMDLEKTGKVTCEVFLSFIEKLGIGAIDHREQNLMFELLKEENRDYISFSSFYRCSGETVTTLSELNQHLVSVYGSSRMAFESFFKTLKKSTTCSQVDFLHVLSQVGIGEDYANKLFEELDVCKTQSVTVFTMLKMLVGDWDQKVAFEYEQKINTNLNRLLTYLSPESLEEFNKEFTRTLSSQFFDKDLEGSLTDFYEEFYIERDLQYFDELSSVLSQHKEFDGISMAQKRLIVSLFNVVDTSVNAQEYFMQYESEVEDQEVVLVASNEVDVPLVALLSGTLEMSFEGLTYPKHLTMDTPGLSNYEQFQSSLERYTSRGYPPYPGDVESEREAPVPKECGYNITFKIGPNRNTVVGMMPLSVYLYNVVPLLVERNRRLPVMLQFLKLVPSFSVYTPEELEKIVAACTVRQFKLHETVIKTGEAPTHFYLVFDGTLTVTNEYNFEYKTLGKTDFFSAYDLVNNQVNDFTLIANCTVVLLSWERNEFFRVFTKYSGLVENDSCNLNDFQNLSLQKFVDKKVSFAE